MKAGDARQLMKSFMLLKAEYPEKNGGILEKVLDAIFDTIQDDNINVKLYGQTKIIREKE